MHKLNSPGQEPEREFIYPMRIIGNGNVLSEWMDGFTLFNLEAMQKIVCDRKGRR